MALALRHLAAPPPAPLEILARAAAFDLIDVSRAIPNLDIALPYASSENVAGRPVYPQRMPCLLRRSTAQKLAYAQYLLNQQGLSQPTPVVSAVQIGLILP